MSAWRPSARRRVLVLRAGKVPARTSSMYVRVAVDDRVAELGEVFDELRRVVARHPEQIGADEHLAVASAPRADADGGDAHGRASRATRLRRASLRARSRRRRPARARSASATMRSAASSVLPWTRNPPSACTRCGASPTCPMTGMPMRDHPRDVLGDLDAALDLHALEGALFHHLAGVLDRLLGRDLKAHERHVADEVRARRARERPRGRGSKSRRPSPAACWRAPAPPCRANRRRGRCRRRLRRAAAPS